MLPSDAGTSHEAADLLSKRYHESESVKNDRKKKCQDTDRNVSQNDYVACDVCLECIRMSAFYAIE